MDIRRLMAALCLVMAGYGGIAMPAGAQALGMPSVDQVKRAVQADNALQTLGTQCIVLAELLRMVPKAFRESHPQEWQRIRGAYDDETGTLMGLIGGGRLAGDPSMADRNRWGRVCQSSRTYQDGDPRTSDLHGSSGLPMPSRDDVKGLLKGEALSAVNQWENRPRSAQQAGGKPSEFSQMLQDSKGIALKLLGVVLVIAGFAGFIFVARRRFYRRNQAGIEEFNSYGAAVGNQVLEGFVGWMSLGALVAGVLLAMLA